MKSDPPSSERMGLWRGKHAEVGMGRVAIWLEQSAEESRARRAKRIA